MCVFALNQYLKGLKDYINNNNNIFLDFFRSSKALVNFLTIYYFID